MPDEITPVAAPESDNTSLMGIIEEAGGVDDTIETGFDDDSTDTGTDGPDAADGAVPGSEEGNAEPAGETEATGDPDPRDAALKQLQDLNDSFTSDPAGFIKQLIAGLDPQQQAAILGGQPGEPAAKPDELETDYEPQSRFEEVFTPVLRKLPETIAGHVQREVSGGINQMVPYVDHANITASIALAQISALADMVGLSLPQVDLGAVAKAANTGKTTYADAVKQLMGEPLKAAVATAKQARAPRPAVQPTVTQQIDGLQRDGRGRMSLADIARAVGGTR